MSKIFIIGIFLCAFSLNSQVIYENKQLILETKILAADDGFLLSIINKTDFERKSNNYNKPKKKKNEKYMSKPESTHVPSTISF